MRSRVNPGALTVAAVVVGPADSRLISAGANATEKAAGPATDATISGAGGGVEAVGFTEASGQLPAKTVFVLVSEEERTPDRVFVVGAVVAVVIMFGGAVLKGGMVHQGIEGLTIGGVGIQVGISQVEPGQGDVAGGYLVMLSGAGFKNGLSVLFCGEPVAGAQVLSSNAVVVTAPAGEVGACDVEVMNPDGNSASIDNGFVYTAEEISEAGPSAGLVYPKTGPVEGGTWVLVSGENFAVGVGVAFEGVAAPAVMRIDATQVMVFCLSWKWTVGVGR